MGGCDRADVHDDSRCTLSADTLARSQIPLAISNASSLVAVLAFGLTDQYSVAIAARLLAGAFNSTFV